MKKNLSHEFMNYWTKRDFEVWDFCTEPKEYFSYGPVINWCYPERTHNVLSDFTELKNMQDPSLSACTVCTISQKPLTIEWFFFYVGHAASWTTYFRK